jgi:hypothetical protein
MPRLARSDLEQLLQARRLGPTLVSPPSGSAVLADERTVCPTGAGRLDESLRGGWPRGQVSEVVGPLSAGGSWVTCVSLAAATRRGELAALVDPLDRFDPESAATAGMVWPSLLWVRGGGRGPEAAAVERGMKALALILRAEGFGLVVLDLQGVSASAVRALPYTTWRRVQRMVEGRDTACLLAHHASLGRSAGGATLRLDPPPRGGGCWTGQGRHGRRLVGLAARVRALRGQEVGPGLDGVEWRTNDVRLPD